MNGPFPWSAPSPRPLAEVHVHDDTCGHDHLSTGERLSMGLWSGLALALAAIVALGLVLGAKLVRRRAAARVPCPGCGTFFDPAGGAPCPSCGRALQGDSHGLRP